MALIGADENAVVDERLRAAGLGHVELKTFHAVNSTGCCFMCATNTFHELPDTVFLCSTCGREAHLRCVPFDRADLEHANFFCSRACRDFQASAHANEATVRVETIEIQSFPAHAHQLGLEEKTRNSLEGEAGDGTGLHSHHYAEVLYVCEGEIVVESVGRSPDRVVAGQVVTIEPDAPHRVRIAAATKYVYAMLHRGGAVRVPEALIPLFNSIDELDRKNAELGDQLAHAAVAHAPLLTERATAITVRDAAITARDAAITARDTAINARDAAVAERDEANAERDAAVTARDDANTARDAAVADYDALQTELDNMLKRRRME